MFTKELERGEKERKSFLLTRSKFLSQLGHQQNSLRACVRVRARACVRKMLTDEVNSSSSEAADDRSFCGDQRCICRVGRRQKVIVDFRTSGRLTAAFSHVKIKERREETDSPLRILRGPVRLFRGKIRIYMEAEASLKNTKYKHGAIF